MDGNYIGLISGTSADSIDAVIVSIIDNKLTLINNYSHPIPKKTQEKIWSMNNSDGNGNELKTMLELDNQLGNLFADAVNCLLKNVSNKIIAIGTHGQTLRHYPDSKFPTTLQIGDANIIVEKTNITTICDFRRADMAAGGQGAPLVPAFHQFEFQHDSINQAIVNIGGIANITYLPATQCHSNTNPISGFDTGPGNGLMDEWIQKKKQLAYDNNGEWAQTGNIDKTLLTLFLDHPYFLVHKPKSTGRDIFNLNWVESILEKYQINDEDVQATLCALTAYSITNSLISLNEVKEVYICGGGIHNLTLIKMLTGLLSDKNIRCSSTDDLGLSPDWVEACAFAWLAWQRINYQPGNCPSVTGASHHCILGAIYSPINNT